MSTSAERFGDDFGAERMWGLKELPLPEPIGYWPQATGWYVVAAVVVLMLAWWLWRRWQSWQGNAYRRDALVRIDAMAEDPALLADLPLVLRRCALLAYRRSEVASLRGEAWIEWLNRTAKRDLFSKDDARLIDALAYAGDSRLGADCDALARLLASSKSWVRSHHA